MTALQMPAKMRDLMIDFMRDIERVEMDRAEVEAKKDPAAYRDSQIIERGKDTRFHYYSAPKGALPGHRVTFCYSKHRNIAGYYLTWTETWKGDRGRRSNFHGWETKRAAIDYCLDRLRDSRRPKSERRFVLPRL